MDSLIHPFPPVYDAHSRILVLGTFPSVMSRKNCFYYGQPQNRFWQVLSHILEVPCPHTIEEKKALLLTHGVALWDVLASCRIASSADSSIKEPVANDFSQIFKTAHIRAVFTNGQKAGFLYRRFALPQTGMPSVCLPSTSPANCRMGFDELVGEWQVIGEYLIEKEI
jgi:TDG/mug DNA glycosylase family protein